MRASLFRKVAQLAARVAHTHEVAGSSPALATKPILSSMSGCRYPCGFAPPPSFPVAVAFFYSAVCM